MTQESKRCGTAGQRNSTAWHRMSQASPGIQQHSHRNKGCESPCKSSSQVQELQSFTEVSPSFVVDQPGRSYAPHSSHLLTPPPFLGQQRKLETKWNLKIEVKNYLLRQIRKKKKHSYMYKSTTQLFVTFRPACLTIQ